MTARPRARRDALRGRLAALAPLGAPASRPAPVVVAALLALAGLAAPAAPGGAGGAGGRAAAQEPTAASSPAAPVDSLLAAGRLQEAAWAAGEAGDHARADAILERLEAILRRAPRSARPLSMDSQGVSYTFLLDHGDGVRSIFKVDGSDIFCPACGADREIAVYRIDRLLGIALTPMTVPQRVVHDGDTLRGSAMYFVEGGRQPEEVDARKPDALRFLDVVVGNSDRHRHNWLVLGSGRVVAIDHNRAFDYHPRTRPKTCWETEADSIRAPGALGPAFQRYRALPPDSLAAVVGDLADRNLAREFVEMRPRVVDRIRARVREPQRLPPLKDCAFRG